MQTDLWELRRYRSTPGRADELQRRFDEAAIPAFRRCRISFHSLWRNVQDADEFWYLLRFESSEQRDEAWERFRSDPIWRQAKKASEAAGPLIAEHESILLDSLTMTGTSEGGTHS